MIVRASSLYIEECLVSMFNDVCLTRRNIVAHQCGSESAGIDCVFDGDLFELASCRIHCGVPQLLCIHFAYVFSIISDSTDYFFTPDCQSICVPNVSKRVSIASVLSDKGDSRYRGISASHEINFTLMRFDMRTVVFSLPR